MHRGSCGGIVVCKTTCGWFDSNPMLYKEESLHNIMDLVVQVQKKYPEWRMGQVLSNAAKAGGWKEFDIFFCQDEKIIEGLKKILKT